MIEPPMARKKRAGLPDAARPWATVVATVIAVSALVVALASFGAANKANELTEDQNRATVARLFSEAYEHVYRAETRSRSGRQLNDAFCASVLASDLEAARDLLSAERSALRDGSDELGSAAALYYALARLGVDVEVELASIEMLRDRNGDISDEISEVENSLTRLGDQQEGGTNRPLVLEVMTQACTSAE